MIRDKEYVTYDLDRETEMLALRNSAFAISEIVTPDATPGERRQMADWLSKIARYVPYQGGRTLYFGSGNPITPYLFGPTKEDIASMHGVFAEKYGLDDPASSK